MRFRLSACVLLSLPVFLGVLPALGEEPAAPPALAARATPKSVAVFPIILNSGEPIPGVSADMSKSISQVVGLLLERGGVRKVEIADAKFAPPAKADLAQLAETFGQFVQTQNLDTEYTLCGQFFGTPGKGVDEIRLVVADRQGKIVLTKRLDRRQLVMKRLPRGEDKVCPMVASCWLVDELRAPWKLADPNRSDAPQGPMARLWEEKSGLPPEGERKAMQSRLDELKKTIKATTIVVYPIRLSGKGDVQAAAQLAEMLTKADLGHAESCQTDPGLQIEGNTNQTRIAWDGARAFQEFLRVNPPTADYALLAEYGIARSADGKVAVGGIQLALCDHKGDWVLVDLRNDHHADFQRIAPQSPDDCSRLVVEMLKDKLR